MTSEIRTKSQDFECLSIRLLLNVKQNCFALGFLIEHTRKGAGNQVSKSPITPKDSLYRETKNLLRYLMVLTQGLNILPDVAYLTIKTSYHADTPDE